MLKVCLTIDCEKFISFKQGNPKWGSFERLKGKVNNLIKNIRYNKNGFEVVCKTLVKENFPATMMLVGSLFPKQEPVKNIEWGYHTLNHLPLTLINDESLQQEVKNIYRAKSFSAPMWMIEDIKAPSRIFSLLKKQGYTHAVYDGENDGIKSFHYRAIKMPCKKEGIVCIHLSTNSGIVDGLQDKPNMLHPSDFGAIQSKWASTNSGVIAGF